MKLVTALELAEECGLETVNEAIRNVFIHSGQLFTFDKGFEERAELLADWRNVESSTNFDISSSVRDVLEWLRKE